MQRSLGRWFESGSRDNFFFVIQGLFYPFFELQKIVPRVRLELTTFRSLLRWIHYETDALPTALPRQLSQAYSKFAQIPIFDIANNDMKEERR